jgi:AcrR family transcriptional regulator
MTGDVNPGGALPPLRQAQVAHTEQRILAAATELFLAHGYLATTLESVARRAQVGARTVYVRFGTKAALFKRVIDGPSSATPNRWTCWAATGCRPR